MYCKILYDIKKISYKKTCIAIKFAQNFGRDLLDMEDFVKFWWKLTRKN